MKSIEELEKGCGIIERIGIGKLSPAKSRELCRGIKCGEYVKEWKEVFYCDICEAKLQQAKADREMFLGIIDELIKRLDFGWEFVNDDGQNDLSRIIKAVEELKKQIGEMK